MKEERIVHKCPCCKKKIIAVAYTSPEMPGLFYCTPKCAQEHAKKNVHTMKTGTTM